MEGTINFQELLYLFKKHIKLIIAIILGALAICAVITFFIMTPQYQASTQILVNQTQENDQQSITASEVQSNREFISTYSVIITSPRILEEVIAETGVDKSVEDLRSSISIASEEESQVATLTVEDSNPQTAVNLANNTSRVFEREITEIMTVNNVSILSEAQEGENTSPVTPQPTLNFVIALFIGAIIGFGVAVLIEFLDQTIKTEQDIEKHLKLPLLGAIPIMDVQDLKNISNTNLESANSSSEYQKDHKRSKRKMS